MTMTAEQLAQLRADIERRNTLPAFGPDTSIERIKIINDTQRSFTPEVVEALLDELERKETRVDKISLDYDHLVDEANRIAEQRDELIIRNHKMAELLINLKKARPGGVYFNKWDTQIEIVLLAAGINLTVEG